MGDGPVDFLGIDISKGDFHAHLLQGNRSAKKVFPNSLVGYKQLGKWLDNRKSSDLHSCMEATGAYWLGTAMFLHSHYGKVSVVNPTCIKMFARSKLRRTKTDSVDAEIIAEYCSTQNPRAWVPPAKEILEIRALLTYRDELVAEKLRVKQISTSVHEAGVFHATATQHREKLEEFIKNVEQQLRELIQNTSELSIAAKNLQTIPGIGWLTAASLLARLPMDRLANSKAAAAHAGLAPRERQSGTSVHGRARICKTGDAHLRKALYMPALAVLRGSSPLGQFAARLTAAGKPGKVVVVAVMRKLVTIAYAILKSGKPYSVPAMS